MKTSNSVFWGVSLNRQLPGPQARPTLTTRHECQLPKLATPKKRGLPRKAFRTGLTQRLCKLWKVAGELNNGRKRWTPWNLLVNIIVTKSGTTGILCFPMRYSSTSCDMSLPQRRSNLSGIKPQDTTIQVYRKQRVQRTTSCITARLQLAKSRMLEILQDKWLAFFNKYTVLKNKNKKTIGEGAVWGSEKPGTHKPNAMCGLCLDPDSDQPTIKWHFWDTWGKLNTDGVDDTNSVTECHNGAMVNIFLENLTNGYHTLTFHRWNDKIFGNCFQNTPGKKEVWMWIHKARVAELITVEDRWVTGTCDSLNYSLSFYIYSKFSIITFFLLKGKKHGEEWYIINIQTNQQCCTVIRRW